MDPCASPVQVVGHPAQRHAPTPPTRWSLHLGGCVDMVSRLVAQPGVGPSFQNTGFYLLTEPGPVAVTWLCTLNSQACQSQANEKTQP